MSILDEDFGELIRNIHPDKMDIKTLLAKLNSNDPKSISVASVEEAQVAMGLMVDIIQDLKDKVARYESILDEKADDFIDKILLTVKSYPDAVTAIDTYDTEWFNNLQLSDNAKIRLAESLTQAAAKYNCKNPFWATLSTGDLGALT